MLEHIFGSKTRLKLLKVFFKEPDKPFFIRELTREIDAHINAVRREIDLLIKVGLLEEIEENKTTKTSSSTLKKYYTLNKDCLFFVEMKALLAKAQAAGEQELVRKIRQNAGTFKLIVLSGKLVGDENAATDLLLVGKIKERVLEKLINQYEKGTGVEIRFTIMSEEEFLDRRYVMDRFLFSVLEGNNLKVVNEFKI